MPGSAMADAVLHNARKSGAEEKTDIELEGKEAYVVSEDEASTKVVADHTHRRLRPRHIHLIAIGGTIGTALYVSSAAFGKT